MTSRAELLQVRTDALVANDPDSQPLIFPSPCRRQGYNRFRAYYSICLLAFVPELIRHGFTCCIQSIPLYIGLHDPIQARFVFFGLR